MHLSVFASASRYRLLAIQAIFADGRSGVLKFECWTIDWFALTGMCVLNQSRFCFPNKEHPTRMIVTLGKTLYAQLNFAAIVLL